jgi:hypothetical protein
MLSRITRTISFFSNLENPIDQITYLIDRKMCTTDCGIYFWEIPKKEPKTEYGKYIRTIHYP